MALPQPIFHVRGSSITPYYSKGSRAYSTFRTSGNSDTAVLADAGAIGGSVVNFSATSNSRALQYMGQLNWPSTREMAFAWRFKQVTGASAPPKGQNLVFGASAIQSFSCAGTINWTTGNKLFIDFPDRFGLDIFATSAVSLSWVAGQYTTLVVVIDTLSATKTAKIYQGIGTATPTLIETVTLSGSFSGTYDQNQVSSINLGYSTLTGGSSSVDYYLDWFAIFDGLIDGTEVSGSAYPSSLNLNGDVLAGVGDIRLGVVNGLTTGTAVIPSLANTKTGVAGDGGTGTYDGSDRWTDPGQANVRLATAYKANSTSNNRTGAMIAAAAATTKVSVTADDGVGTYNGSDRWTDLSEDTVKLAVPYKANSTSENKVGTYRGEDLYDTVPEDKVELGYEYLANGVTLEGNLPRVLNTFTGAKLRGNRNE